VEYSIDARVLESEGGNEMDLVCRWVDVSNLYEFRVYDDGFVGIGKWLNSEYVELSEFVETGISFMDGPHRITVTCDGTRLALSIDGNLVVETTDDSFTSGDIGVAAYAWQESGRFAVAFDNLEAKVLGGAPQVSEGETAIYDEFTSNSLGWDVSSDSDFARYVQEGRYFMEVHPNQFTVWSAINSQNFENLVINVDVNVDQAAHDGDIGVLCRYIDSDNHYALEVSEDGYYTIWKRVNGEVIYIVEWAPSDLIPTDGSPFVVNASCDGAQLSVGINGNMLATGTDTDFSTGGVGMIAGTWENPSLTVSFDNFEVIEY
jgi:hypothetical protein